MHTHRAPGERGQQMWARGRLNIHATGAARTYGVPAVCWALVSAQPSPLASEGAIHHLFTLQSREVKSLAQSLASGKPEVRTQTQATGLLLQKNFFSIALVTIYHRGQQTTTRGENRTRHVFLNGP